TLVEKQITTPNNYPLTLTSLTTACNQKSNRHPVMDLTEEETVRALYSLRERNIAWETAPAGSRVMKYSHEISRLLPLTDRQLAVLTELMLRGPQTIGELRTHCERMHPLGDITQAAEVVQSLIDDADSPRVVKLPREPGRRENRYAHLLCGEPDISDEPVDIAPSAAVAAVRTENERIAELENQIGKLQQEVAELTEQFGKFKKQFD
ncbi:MAG TPA: DUF480 domain-containing protein, partial [Tichowtungia sp.]|nr:DUF480 domain-containing protein [Tichowtungia sp.]